MPKMHLRKPEFTYSACGTFTKSKETIKKVKEIGYSRYIYQDKLDKACFQHDMAYGKFKKIQIEEQLLIKYCVRKYLILLKTWNMMNTKEVLL